MISTLSAAVLILVFCTSCSKNVPLPGGPGQYTTSELDKMNLPVWEVTKPIPVSPPDAVAAGLTFLKKSRSEIASWDVDRIELGSDFTKHWVYSLTFVNRVKQPYDLVIVKVLMNGEVWVPSYSQK